MYEDAKAQARQDFVLRFVWTDAYGVALKARSGDEAQVCAACETRPGVYRWYDNEDEVSGGAPWCQECLEALQQEAEEMEPWVTQDPVGAWEGVGAAAGNGWSGLWFLFAPPGQYSKAGTWPYGQE